MRIFFKYTLFYSTHIPCEGNQSNNRQCCLKKNAVVLQIHNEHSLTLVIDMNANKKKEVYFFAVRQQLTDGTLEFVGVKCQAVVSLCINLYLPEGKGGKYLTHCGTQPAVHIWLSICGLQLPSSFPPQHPEKMSVIISCSLTSDAPIGSL